MNLAKIIFAITLLTAPFMAQAADPTATKYTAHECLGTYMPYPADVRPTILPDTLKPVALAHVGRHGARFLSSDKALKQLTQALDQATKAKTITPAGRELLRLCHQIERRTAGRWGALDSLGMAEQAMIATHMAQTFPALFDGGKVEALSSYSPRCIMSMYCFAHQLSRLNNKLEIFTQSGRQNSPLMRPFDLDADYRAFREEGTANLPVAELKAQLLRPTAVLRVLGQNFPDAADTELLTSLEMAMYSVVRCCPAMGMPNLLDRFFTPAEMNALWAVDNLTHYLRYSASTLTTTTSEMAAPLLLNLIQTLDDAARGLPGAAVTLRFGHAETLMPLLALMHLPGCYYMTNYWDTVALHWRDFYVVPMASNLQLVLLQHTKNKELYLRVDLNEVPVPLIPGRAAIYTPWAAAREYLNRCLPLLYQL